MAPHLSDYVARAHVGLVKGAAVLVGVGVFFVTLVLLALTPPSEQMKAWSSLPAPIERIKPGAWDPAGGPPRSERRADGRLALRAASTGGRPGSAGPEHRDEDGGRDDQDELEGSADPQEVREAVSAR